MIKCPNEALPEWKELVEVVGENKAHYLWDLNNGHSLDKTPSGLPSKLFSDLLSHYNGDRNDAIQAKAKVYSEAFKNWFGDWLSDDKTNVSKVVDENGEPLVVYHGTRTSHSIKNQGFSKSMSGKGNRGADNLQFYFTNSYENAEYTGVKAKELNPLIDVITSVYDLFGSTLLPTYDQLYQLINQNRNKIKELHNRLRNVKDDSFIKRIFNSLLSIFNVNVSTADDLRERYNDAINDLDSLIKDLLHKIEVLYNFNAGMKFMSGDRTQTSVNTLNFIKESINDNSPYRQFAANQLINLLYGTHDLLYSPEVLPVFLNIKAPLITDFKFKSTDENPLFMDRFSDELEKYNNREQDLLRRLSSDKFDGSISKNKFDILFGDIYIAKEPNQIKSIDNQGTFSTLDNDIYNVESVEGIENMTTDLPFDRVNRMSNYLVNQLTLKTKAYNPRNTKYFQYLIGDLNNDLFGIRYVVDSDIKSLQYLDEIQFFIYNSLRDKLQNQIDLVLQDLKNSVQIDRFAIENALKSFLYSNKLLDKFDSNTREILLAILPRKVLSRADNKLIGYYKHMLISEGANKLKTKMESFTKESYLTKFKLLAKLNKLQTVADALDYIPGSRKMIFDKYISEYLRYRVYDSKPTKNGSSFFKGFSDLLETNALQDKYYNSAYLEEAVFPLLVIEKGSNAKLILQIIISNSKDLQSVEIAKLLLPYASESTLINFIGVNREGKLTTGGTFYGKSKNIDIFTFSELFLKHPEHTVIHEIIHSLTVQYISSNEEVYSLLEEIILYLKDRSLNLDSPWYAFSNPYELIAEFMSNPAFREFTSIILVEKENRSLFLKILDIILRWIHRDSRNTVFDYLTDISKGIIDALYQQKVSDQLGVEQSYALNLMIFNLSSLSQELILEINKTYSRIQQGLKNRLKSVKRYATKNPKLWRQLETVINQLSNSEAEQGILQFLQHVSDTIGEALTFLRKPIDLINAKLIRQLSLDYVGFYKPLLDEIIALTDTTDLFKDLPNYNDLVANMQTLSVNMNLIFNRFNNVLRVKGKSELLTYLQLNGMPQEYIDKTILWLDDPTVDSSIFLNWFGMASNSDNAVLQAIAKLLNDTMNGTERETMSKGIELVKIVLEAKEKYGVDVLKLLYEKLSDGTYSGYIVKPINHGQYKKDKTEYLDKVAAELGITKDEDGYYDIPADDDIQQKWYEAVNKFYSEKVNRRFTPEYYKLRNEYLSNKTRQAIDEILDYIYSIISSVTRDGIVYENELTDSEYNQLLELRKLKRLLANPYNLDGSIKTGTAGLIAEELRKFNEAVGELDYVVDYDRYNRDLLKVIARYGSKDDPRVKLWIARNTRTRFTQEFYDRLDALNDVELTLLYEDLVERRRLFRQLFSNPETGLIVAERLSDSERALLLQLDKDISAERTVSNEKRPEEADNFKLFAEVVYTDEYYRDYKLALNAGLLAFNDWYWKNHYENAYGIVVPASYYTQLKPKDLDKYSETVPTGRYSTIDASSKWFNKDFDQSGPAIQPKKEFYNNSKAYREVMDKPEIKALYEAIERTMLEANSLIPFLNNLDDGRMPLMPARLTQVWNRLSGIMLRLGYVWDEVAVTLADDLDYVEDEGVMPNGDPIKLIPTRFIRMLKNPNIISTDAVSAVIAYYHMATNFKNMLLNQDLIELLLNLLRSVQIRNRKGVKPAGSSNIYKLAQLLVDRLMYGKNMTPILWKVGDKEINISKVATNILNFVRKVNLSGNIWSIATSFFTDSTYTTMEAMLGRFFDTDDLRFAVVEFEKQLPDMMANIGNPIPKGKLPYLLQLNQVVKSNQEIFNRLDLSQVLRSINLNFWYAGYTQSDYIVKSHTLISIYHNYRLVDGKFLSKNEYLNLYYPNDRKAGEVAFKQLKTTLWDAYNDDGSVKKEYEKAVTTQLLNKVKNRIDVLSRRIDGTIREVDKAAVHAHALALYIVLHKNFMISGLHDRFKKKHFNLDTGVEEEGYYRVTASFLKGIVGNRHFALNQILADYDLLKDYEQYAVRRVLYDMMLIVASTTLALSIAALVDGDDDYDNWVMLSITYLVLRSAFEFRTMYNPFEFMSMIKSPTAAFTWFDNASSFINLFNPFSYIGKGGPFKIIDRGVYEGMPRILRNMIKVTPIRSIIEAVDPKSKRSYLLNQLMTF